MSTEIINIKKQEGNDHLYLTDNEGHAGKDTITTTVKNGDTVTWKLDPNGGIDQITGITAKPGSQNLFSEGPAPVDIKDPKTDWTGTIGKDATGSESYTIAYKIGDQALVDDPKLRINN
ncbi:hypothetical protein SAMN05661096_02233 [Marivirga sericea]|uniref:Uncharacterized protein n=1 Tax=Marivirga sericea TaxID=1028 RepID=A0A1X7K0P0_9BACT|nr:hypothetical protein [Marivirga sericea]SMG34307.1 hypothetical protein SAMN05661096_02233 [Marivirga sericea]